MTLPSGPANPNVSPEDLARARAGARGSPRGAPGDGVRFTSSFGDEGIDLDEIFGGMFGGGGFGSGSFSGGRRSRGRVPGADQEAELVLSVEEAFRGGRRTIRLSGSDAPRTFEVDVPPGVVSGQHIRLRGQGGRGGGGAPPPGRPPG